MPSPPVIDVDALLLPVPGPDPAGEPLADADRFALDARRGDPDGHDKDRPADWPGVVAVASDVLTNRSKDLLAAARLVEALVRSAGPAGLRDGLRLLARLCADCWDRLHPAPGPGEGMDVREGPFKLLNDATRGAKLPAAVAQTPLARVDGRAFAQVDWAKAATRAELEELFARTKHPEAVRVPHEDLTAAKAALAELQATLNAKMGSDYAPDFLSPDTPNNLGPAVDRCLAVLADLAHRRSVPLGDAPPPPVPDAPPPDAPAAAGAARGQGDPAQTRDGLYRQVERVAAELRAIEPHSPVPYLLDRCVRLGQLPFPALIRALVTEQATLAELDRLLGVASEGVRGEG